tara:strand:- start:1638 stop:2744 length:1107 start_codon:yes stop_codon:yes gene_type:complete
MAKVSSPSDYTNIDVNYATGKGYYTTHSEVSGLLQIGAFSASTTPNIEEVGRLIKKVEDRIDETTKMSYRPILYHKEFHHFDAVNRSAYPVTEWKDYVGFIQLEHRKIQKLIRLEVWKGSSWVDLASATAKIKVPSSATSNSVSWRIRLGVGTLNFDLVEGVAFDDTYGPKTTASQIADCINEVFPAKTARFTNTTAPRTTTANGNTNYNISDFFYATTDSEAGDTVIISSLLMGDDGSTCTISSVDTDNSDAAVGTVTAFTDKETQGRNSNYWQMTDDGKIFFRTEYPNLQHASIKATYVAGDARVPAAIHDAATKFVAAEVIRHDDNSILIAETGSNIDLKTKHDILIEEATAILDGKKESVYFIS